MWLQHYNKHHLRGGSCVVPAQLLDFLWLHGPVFSGGTVVKILPAMQVSWVWFLGSEDSLEEEMAAHSSIYAWKIPWTEEPGWLQSMALQRAGGDWAHLGNPAVHLGLAAPGTARDALPVFSLTPTTPISGYYPHFTCEHPSSETLTFPSVRIRMGKQL